MCVGALTWRAISASPSQVGKLWLAAVVARGARAGKAGAAPLMLDDFVGRVEMLAWAKANQCPWLERTCALAAESGRLEVLQWAREHGCPWDSGTCACAAQGGHLEVLKWAWEHDCPPGPLMLMCEKAAGIGHLEMLQWMRERNCQWDCMTCARAAEGGHLVVLQWAWEYDCPWGAYNLCVGR